MPFVFLKLLWRGIKAPEYKARRLERFGFFKAPKLNSPIWVHAVSVGETLAAEPIVRALLARYPERDIVITTMTPTSSERIYSLFGDDVFHVYAPYDMPFMVKAFLKRIQPKQLIIMETELWPNMIHYTRELNCPVILANARLSERSARGYRRLNPIIGWMLNELSLVLCQFANDAARFRSLGIDQEKIHVTGSVKFDIEVAEGLEAQADFIRQHLADSRPVWIAASTHEGEDEQILEAHADVRRRFGEAILILVPRHPERFDSAYKLAEERGFKTVKRTEYEQIPADVEVYIGNTMGEMMALFSVADIAFVGGSLVPVGGHNPLEPGALGKPILMGPELFNFEAICQQLEVAGGLTIVQNSAQLAECLNTLFCEPVSAKEMGQKALSEVEAGKGAVKRVVEHISPLLDGACSN